MKGLRACFWMLQYMKRMGWLELYKNTCSNEKGDIKREIGMTAREKRGKDCDIELRT